MKRHLLVLTVAALSCLGFAWGAQQGEQAQPPQQALPAQPPQGGPAGAAQMASRMKERLGLSDQQAQQVEQVIEDFRKRMGAMRANGGSTSGNGREERRRLMEERDSKLKAILTPEQWQKLQQMRSQGRQRRSLRRQQFQGQPGLSQPRAADPQQAQARQGRMDPATFATRVKERIGLSDQQTDQVRETMQDFQNRMQQLSQQRQAANQGSRQSMRDERDKLVEERNARLKAILTPDQWTQFQQMMAQMRQGRRRQNPGQAPQQERNPQ